jgi:phenylpropionate dioxygenase-like ring-hydroxylating dioxygenase large terminal subunit
MVASLNVQTLSGSEIRRDFVPASDYSPEFHRLEMERLWPRVWQIACREEEIPHEGDYVNYEIGNESILVVRNSSGSIKAFYNVCSHRGRRLRDDAKGNRKAFFCGYHAWTFDLDGQVTAIPSREDWKSCPQFSDSDLALSPVKADNWAGFVWINMDPNCPPLREFLAPLPEKLDAFEWDKCRLRSYQTIIFPINWKVALEAFVEAYHVIGTHPQLLRFGSIYSPGLEQYIGPELRHGAHTGHYHYDFNENAEFTDPRKYVYEHTLSIYNELHGIFHEAGVRAAERVLAELPEGLTLQEVYVHFAAFQREEIVTSGAQPAELGPAHFEATEWQIFPNSSILPSPEGAFWYRSRPNGDDPNSTIFDIWSLGRYAPGKEPKITQEIYTTLESFKGKNPILEQDFSNMLAVHKGTRSRGWKGARPNPVQESNIYNIHRVLHNFIFDQHN